MRVDLEGLGSSSSGSLLTIGELLERIGGDTHRRRNTDGRLERTGAALSCPCIATHEKARPAGVYCNAAGMSEWCIYVLVPETSGVSGHFTSLPVHAGGMMPPKPSSRAASNLASPAAAGAAASRASSRAGEPVSSPTLPPRPPAATAGAAAAAGGGGGGEAAAPEDLHPVPAEQNHQQQEQPPVPAPAGSLSNPLFGAVVFPGDMVLAAGPDGAKALMTAPAGTALLRAPPPPAPTVGKRGADVSETRVLEEELIACAMPIGTSVPLPSI